jgi:hypothetical protein
MGAASRGSSSRIRFARGTRSRSSTSVPQSSPTNYLGGRSSPSFPPVGATHLGTSDNNERRKAGDNAAVQQGFPGRTRWYGASALGGTRTDMARRAAPPHGRSGALFGVGSPSVDCRFGVTRGCLDWRRSARPRSGGGGIRMPVEPGVTFWWERVRPDSPKS